MDEHERGRAFEQKNNLARQSIRRRDALGRELAGEPGLDRLLVAARDGAGGMSRQVRELHDDSGEAWAGPARLRRPIRELRKEQVEKLVEFAGEPIAPTRIRSIASMWWN